MTAPVIYANQQAKSPAMPNLYLTAPQHPHDILIQTESGRRGSNASNASLQRLTNSASHWLGARDRLTSELTFLGYVRTSISLAWHVSVLLTYHHRVFFHHNTQPSYSYST